jgi:hypothetical protein
MRSKEDEGRRKRRLHTVFPAGIGLLAVGGVDNLPRSGW